MKSHSVIRSLPYLSALCVFSALPLQAQEPVSFALNDDFILDEIIVTAQKREQNIQDVPVSVSVYSKESLSNSNVTNFSDLNRLTAGLSVVDIGNGFGSTVRIRGVGQEAFGLTLQPSVAIIIDGIAQPRLDTAFASFLDIERVEVLRGPQGTLWGRNAPAGAITIKTADPDTMEASGSLEGILGTYGTERYVGIANITIIEDVLAVRVTGFSDQRDGSIRLNHFNDSTNFSDRTGGRIKLLYTPSDNLDILLSHESADIESSPARVRVSYGPNINSRATLAGVTLAPLDLFAKRSSVNKNAAFDSLTETSSLSIKLDISDNYAMSFLSGYQEFKNQLFGEVETSSADLFNVSQSRNFDRNFSHELQLTFQGDDLSYLLGAYYSEVSQSGPTELIAGVDGLAVNDAAVQAFTSLGGGPGGFLAAGTSGDLAALAELTSLLKFTLVPDISLLNEYNTAVSALFGHLTYQLSDAFELDGGLRYTTEKVSSNNAGTTSFTVPSPFPGVFIPFPGSAPIDFQDSKTFESVSGNLKFTYSFNENLSLYAGIDYGYKAGGFNGAASSTVSSNPALREFDEETTTNYELGWKSELLDNRLRANGAIFYQTYDDYQVQLPEATTGTNFISNADVISRGVEADITYLLTSNLTLSSTAAYIDAYYDDYKDAACTQPQIAATAAAFGSFAVCTQDLSDTRLNLSSRWSANVNALYQGNSVRVGKSEANFFAFAEVAFRDDFIGDPSGNIETKTESYALLNAKIGLQNDDWEVEFWVKNITDKEYFVNIEESSFSDGTTGIQGERRTAGARVKLYFR